MQMINYFQRFFNYDGWANREVLASFQVAGTPPQRSLKLMAHVLGTEYVWYSRIQGEKSPVAVWPELAPADFPQHAARLIDIWSSYLAGMTPEQFSRPITYKNTKGESWTNSIEDILMHVVMHSAYHRGQIAADMRASGHTPVDTDFIHGVRQKLVG